MNLADALVPRTFTDGELIIEQGDDADGMYFVEEGTVRITRAEQGQDEVQVRDHRGSAVRPATGNSFTTTPLHWWHHHWPRSVASIYYLLKIK